MTVLRADIVVGSGSASFEIIRDLAEKLPVMIAPKWLRTRCRSQRNSISGCRDAEGKRLQQGFCIGGPEAFTYRDMLAQFCAERGLKRLIITVPVMTPRLSSY